MTNGNLPVWIALVMLLSVSLLPILLMVMAFRWLSRARARRRASRLAVKAPAAPAPVSNASATAQGQSPAQMEPPPAGPPETPPAAPPKDPLWEVVLGVVVLGFVFIRTGMAVVSWFTPDYRMLPPSMPKLESRLQDYVEIKGLKKNLETKTLTGKAVIVDKDKASLHPLMRGLPKSIRATTPEDVDFVIWIDAERVPDPDHQVSAAAKPTPQEIAAWNASHPSGSGMPLRTVAVPTYKAKWTATVIDLKKKEIKSTRSFTGPSLPSGELDFRSSWFSGQDRLYVDDKMIKGAEVIFGDKGDVFIGGKRLAGVVAPTPWDETLNWIGQLIKP